MYLFLNSSNVDNEPDILLACVDAMISPWNKCAANINAELLDVVLAFHEYERCREKEVI